jgi:hypothetical protein
MRLRLRLYDFPECLIEFLGIVRSLHLASHINESLVAFGIGQLGLGLGPRLA